MLRVLSWYVVAPLATSHRVPPTPPMVPTGAGSPAKGSTSPAAATGCPAPDSACVPDGQSPCPLTRSGLRGLGRISQRLRHVVASGHNTLMLSAEDRFDCRSNLRRSSSRLYPNYAAWQSRSVRWSTNAWGTFTRSGAQGDVGKVMWVHN